MPFSSRGQEVAPLNLSAAAERLLNTKYIFVFSLPFGEVGGAVAQRIFHPIALRALMYPANLVQNRSSKY